MSDAGTNFISDKFRKFAAGLTWSNHCHQCIMTRAMGRLKPALNSLNAHLKMHQLWWGHSHGIITNPYYPTGARLAKPGNIAI